MWTNIKEKTPPIGVEVIAFSKLPNGKKSMETYHGKDCDRGIWNYVTHWMDVPEDPKDPEQEYDYLGESDPNGDTLCGSLGKMHKWKRYNWDKTLCVHPGCNARC